MASSSKLISFDDGIAEEGVEGVLRAVQVSDSSGPVQRINHSGLNIGGGGWNLSTFKRFNLYLKTNFLLGFVLQLILISAEIAYLCLS